MITLNEIADEVHANAKNKGFHNDGLTRWEFVSRHCNLLHEEVSELFGAVRTGTLDEPCDKAAKMAEMGLKPLSCAEEELADIIIRCLDQCRRLGIDIQTAIETKHRYNCSRPFMHGKKM